MLPAGGYRPFVAYDALAESKRLLTYGLPDPPRALSRRIRFAALGCDVDRDLAMTAFARRGVSGEPMLDAWVLERRDGAWVLLGGGGGSLDHDALADRPPADEMGGWLQLQGGGGARRRTETILPGAGGWASYAELRLAREVALVQVRGRRLPVPRHGHVFVVWPGRRAPSAHLFDVDGAVLTTARLRLNPNLNRRRGETIIDS